MIPNHSCRRYVNEKKPFKASHMFGKNVGKFYVVYSYGEHFPMYIYDFEKDLWYANKSSYSVTTSKHQSQACPTTNRMVYLNINQIEDILYPTNDSKNKNEGFAFTSFDEYSTTRVRPFRAFYSTGERIYKNDIVQVSVNYYSTLARVLSVNETGNVDIVVKNGRHFTVAPSKLLFIERNTTRGLKKEDAVKMEELGYKCSPSNVNYWNIYKLSDIHYPRRIKLWRKQISDDDLQELKNKYRMIKLSY